jgi:pyrimidine operon attenuation protein/uracil phosphoribosyltransferase
VGVGTRTVLSSADIDRAVTRISHEIIEGNRGTSNLLILGIPTRGAWLAERIANSIAKSYPDFNAADSTGRLDVTLFRDDLALKPGKEITQTTLPVSGVDGKTVVLVDDVLFSGRTVRAALDALNEFGRPSAVRLAVLVDRGHRELPIRADYVGKNLPTSLDERIQVRLDETDTENAVVIEG